MNKKFSISKTSIYLILLVLVMVAYTFLYYMPAQQQLQLLNTDIALFKVETDTYRQYLADPSILEADIEAIQTEIDRMNTEDYTNAANVSFMIGDAIQQYEVSLASVTLHDESVFEGYRVLPINLVFSGELNNVHKFIDYFEQNQAGSFRIHNTKLKISNSNVSASMVIYLCTPNV